MIFRQLFDSVSSTYTYLLASRAGGEALLIDPVFEKTDRYLQLLEELDLKLVKVVDTHVHADHVTAMGTLRDRTNCVTVMGEQSPVDVVSIRVGDGDAVTIEGLNLTAMYTPGHTDDSYCFRMDDRVFTGDTLLIRGTGRTDFQNGDAGDQYDSLFGNLLKLPDSMLVYPAHDYKGDMVSTIGEEKAFNPRLQAGSRDAYIELMAGLNLPNPKMMDVAVPENVRMGLNLTRQQQVATVTSRRSSGKRGWHDPCRSSRGGRTGEVGRHPGSMRYSRLDQHLEMLKQAGDRKVVFYCAVGGGRRWLDIANHGGVDGCAHIPGGFVAWTEAGGNISRI